MKFAGPYLLILFLALAAPAFAQRTDTTRSTFSTDTTGGVPAAGSGYVMTKNPTTAILYSIIPGGGQLYNEQYWKVPLFAGAAGYFIVRVFYFNNLYLGKAAEAAKVSTDPLLYPGLKAQRESYRDARDLNAAYFLGVEILGMIDAYVGAHMFDFDVSDDKVSSHIYLNPVNPGIGLHMQW